MDSAAQPLKASASEQLIFVEKQRHVLTRVLKIAQAIEQLHQGLQAALQMGRPAGNISKQAVASFNHLTQQTKKLSTDKLRSLVTQLNKAVSLKINKILKIAQSEDFVHIADLLDQDQHIVEMDDSVNHMLSDFRRNSQTAVSLRVLLTDRGITTPPMTSTVTTEQLLREIHVLNKKKKRCRDTVQKEILALQAEISLFINNKELPDNTRAASEHVYQELQKDLEHLLAGKDIEEMPSFVQVIELGEKAQTVAVKEQPLRQTPENVQPYVESAKPREKKNWSNTLGHFILRLLGRK